MQATRICVGRFRICDDISHNLSADGETALVSCKEYGHAVGQ